jgi:hypothetical protein
MRHWTPDWNILVYLCLTELVTDYLIPVNAPDCLKFGVTGVYEWVSQGQTMALCGLLPCQRGIRGTPPLTASCVTR